MSETILQLPPALDAPDWSSMGATMATLGGLSVTHTLQIIPTYDELSATLDGVVAAFKIREMSPVPTLRKRKIGKFCYVPLSNKPGEMELKVKLCADLARAGFQVVMAAIAPLEKFAFGDLPPGIFIWDTLTEINARQFFKASHAGHFNVVAPRELAYLPADAAVYRAHTNQWAVEIADHILVHDDEAARVWRGMTDSRKIVMTGNPWSTKAKQVADGRIVICPDAPILTAESPASYFERRLRLVGKKPSDDMIRALRAEICSETDRIGDAMECAERFKALYGSRVMVHYEGRHGYRWFNGINTTAGASFTEVLNLASCVVAWHGSPSWRQAEDAGIPCCDMSAKGVQAASVAPKPHHELTICNTLVSLWQRNSYEMPFDVGAAWGARDNQDTGTDVSLLTYANHTAANVAEAACWPVRKLGDCVWALMPDGSMSPKTSAP